MGTTQGLRADAAENRERLLDAAAELFAERGLGAASLNDIAHHAGVGVGTAYRRFANKAEIIDALFERRLQALDDIARSALENPDPWKGLVAFLEGSLDTQFGDLGMRQVINDASLSDARVQETRDRIAPLITALVDRAKDHGVVRPDLDQSDVIFIQVALGAILTTSRHVAPELYRRYLVMFLDGIRLDPPGLTPLPVPPLDPYDTHKAMTQQRKGRPSPRLASTSSTGDKVEQRCRLVLASCGVAWRSRPSGAGLWPVIDERCHTLKPDWTLMATIRPIPAHDLLLCGLDLVCLEVAVVSVIGPDAEPEWGCELHAGEALENVSRAQIMSVGDRDAAQRLLALPWNIYDSRPVL